MCLPLFPICFFVTCMFFGFFPGLIQKGGCDVMCCLLREPFFDVCLTLLLMLTVDMLRQKACVCHATLHLLF